jgi:hypothetical protein
MVGATGRSPPDANRKSDTGESPLAPTAFIFMRHWGTQAHEGLLRKFPVSADIHGVGHYTRKEANSRFKILVFIIPDYDLDFDSRISN